MAAVARDGLINKLPIIVILGATGTGKSKLALQVAKKFDGEIISVDAMQVYKGLDIVTNKVTAEEQREVPHHMIDYLGPGQPIHVGDFKARALQVIEDLQQRRKLPVVAGGTCYYVEALLWNFLMDKHDRPPAAAREPPMKRPRLSASGLGLGDLAYLIEDHPDDVAKDPLEDLTPEDKATLHRALQAVDPARAGQLHPNNVRKVVRSLQVVQSTGRLHSELIREQRAAGGGHLTGPLKFPNSAILWITCQQDVLDARVDARVDQMVAQGLVDELQRFHDRNNLERMKDLDGHGQSDSASSCPQDVLDARLDARVDQMVAQGLVAELQRFHDRHNLERMKDLDGPRTPAYTLGIYQSIGFKEFHPYLMLGEEERKGEKGQKLLEEGVKLMKLATRQYARRQIKWIRKRFLSRGETQVPPVYALDGSDVSRWDSEVKDKAFAIVGSILDGTPCPVPAEPIQSPTIIDHTLTRCEQCDRLFAGKEQFEQHLKSMKHKRQLKKLARLAEQKLPSEAMSSEEKLDSNIPELATSCDKT